MPEPSDSRINVTAVAAKAPQRWTPRKTRRGLPPALRSATPRRCAPRSRYQPWCRPDPRALDTGPARRAQRIRTLINEAQVFEFRHDFASTGGGARVHRCAATAPSALDGLLHHRDELLEREGLGQEGELAALGEVLLERILGIPRDEDDLQRGIALAHLLQQRGPVHFRHHHVRD